MVRGIEKFKEYFKGYTGQYVFIGGTACDILLGNLDLNIRNATYDELLERIKLCYGM